MNQKHFGFKELFDVQLRALQDITIGSKTIEIGEPIAIFQSIQYGNISEVRDYMAATGGFSNSPRVIWENTREVQINFTQGIFSKIHLALLGNSFITNPAEIEVPMMEQQTSDENGKITLKYSPTNIFIYDSNGDKVSNYTKDENIITLTNLPFENVEVVYDFVYKDNDTTILEIGRHWLSGFMELRGKTRLKDDNTGHTVTGVISVPKIKLMSDLSIRLGSSVPPVLGNFNITAFPVGPRGSEKVMDFILLNDDIDSDL